MSAKIYGPEWRVCNVLDTPEIPFEMFGTTVTVPVERKFGHLDTVKAYVNHVCMNENHTVPNVVINKRLKVHATYNWGTISMPLPEKGRWAWREAVVLHEIAHHFAPTNDHGKDFQKIFAKLLDKYIGPEIGWVYQILATEANNV